MRLAGTAAARRGWPVLARGGSPGWWLTLCGTGGLVTALVTEDGLPGAPGSPWVHVLISLVFVAFGVAEWRHDRREARSWWGDRRP